MAFFPLYAQLRSVTGETLRYAAASSRVNHSCGSVGLAGFFGRLIQLPDRLGNDCLHEQPEFLGGDHDVGHGSPRCNASHNEREDTLTVRFPEAQLSRSVGSGAVRRYRGWETSVHQLAAIKEMSDKQPHYRFVGALVSVGVFSISGLLALSGQQDLKRDHFRIPSHDELVEEYEDSVQRIVDKYEADPLVAQLERLPEVASVTVRGEGEKTIVHIADWHFVSRELFAAELPDDATEAETDELYAEFLRSVDAVQREQIAVLRALGVSEVWQEGLTDADAVGFHGLAEAIRDAGEGKAGSAFESMRRDDLRQMGAAGQLLVAGEVKRVLPADDAELLRLGFPLRDGFTEADRERREDEIVRRMVAAGKSPAVLVLGGSHDLSDNLPDGWRVVRVESNAWQTHANERTGGLDNASS